MKKSEWYGVLYFIFCKEKYIQLALNYGPWIHTYSEEYMEECLALKHELTNFNVSSENRKKFNIARSSLFKSFGIMLLLAVVALGVGLITGKVSANLQPDYSKISSFLGVASLTWAGVYQLRYSGERGGFGMELNKVVHKVFFVALLVSGSFLSLLGTL